MRISDWSSDVCSSDLQQDYRERDQEFDKEFVDGVRDVDRLIGNFDKMDTEWKRFVDFAFGHPQIFVQLEAIELGPHVDAQHKRGQIGRASFRERGCSTGRSRWAPYN